MQQDRRAERLYNLEIRRNLTRNYVPLLFHGMLGQTGFRLVTAPTFLPAYILMLADGSNFVVGLALSLQAMGMTLTPMFGATLIEHRKRVLPMGFLAGGLMRGTILMIALSGFFLEGKATLYAIMFSLMLLGMFQGIQGVVFNFLNSKVIPVTHRGRLTGLRNFLAGIISAGVAWAGGKYLIGDIPTSSGYSWTFILAFVLTTTGLLTLLAIKEPEPPTVKSKISLLGRLSEVPALLREDPAFTRYFLARSLATMGRMAMPFYILYAGTKIGLTGPTLGVLTFLFTISGTFSNLIWGYIADKRGFRLTFLLAIVLWVASTLLLMVANDLVLTAIVFTGIGAAFQGFQNASMNLTLEFGDRDNLPVRIAIANTASEIAGTIGPLLGGTLVAIAGYESVFATSILFLVIGGIVVRIYVPEPRYRKM